MLTPTVSDRTTDPPEPGSLRHCIDLYHARKATPINARTAGVTSLGHAVFALERLCAAVAALDPAARRDFVVGAVHDLGRVERGRPASA